MSVYLSQLKCEQLPIAHTHFLNCIGSMLDIRPHISSTKQEKKSTVFK